MEYRRLGSSGLKISEISFGSWINFGTNIDLQLARKCIRLAYNEGVNFFDNAEVYASGVSELIMGEALKEFRRSNVLISTKIFWGGTGPNETGLSWKHLVEGTKASLRRMQLEYVDLLYCHRPDPSTPIEETVRAMDYLIKSGHAFYWGTSEWPAESIEEAHRIARQIHAIPPAMEQPEYNLFARKRVEDEYAPLYKKYGMGLTTWSPLDSGVLTGKYNDGIPPGSRLALHPELRSLLNPEKIEKVKSLSEIAKSLNCSLAQLAIAWCLKNPNVSSVITGATSTTQVKDNLEACKIKNQLTVDLVKEIEGIVGKP